MGVDYDLKPIVLLKMWKDSPKNDVYVNHLSVTMMEVEKFKSPTPIQKIQRIKSNPHNIIINRSSISSFANLQRSIRKI